MGFFKISREKIDASDLFVIIGTEDYVRSLSDPADSEYHSIVEQIITAKHLCRPLVLLIDTNMDKKDKEYLRNYFKGFKVIEELPLNDTDDDSVKKTVKRLVALLGRDK